jgi:hypothetical protein
VALRFFFEGCCRLVRAVLLEVDDGSMRSGQGECGKNLLTETLGGTVGFVSLGGFLVARIVAKSCTQLLRRVSICSLNGYPQIDLPTATFPSSENSGNVLRCV